MEPLSVPCLTELDSDPEHSVQSIHCRRNLSHKAFPHFGEFNCSGCLSEQRQAKMGFKLLQGMAHCTAEGDNSSLRAPPRMQPSWAIVRNASTCTVWNCCVERSLQQVCHQRLLTLLWTTFNALRQSQRFIPFLAFSYSNDSPV